MPDMPWEDRPAGSKEVMWRYSARIQSSRVDALSTSNSAFSTRRSFPSRKASITMRAFSAATTPTAACASTHAFSVDGLRVGDLRGVRLPARGRRSPRSAEWVYGYDPRVAKIDDKYYVTWCNGYHGPTIGIAWTDDFETFHQLENALHPLSTATGFCSPARSTAVSPCCRVRATTGHTAFGDIFYSESLRTWSSGAATGM